MQKIMKRIMAVVLLVSMAAASIGIVPRKVEASTTYRYKANLRNLLSDYQYVVKENLEAKTHTMGGVAVGGNCKMADFADAMVSPSYAGNLVKVGNVKDTPSTGVPEGYHTKKFYYTYKAANAFENYQASKFEQNTYLDMVSAFHTIQSESTALVSGAEKAVVTGNKIIIDFSKAKKYEVPANLISSDRSVTLDIVGLASPDDLRDEEYSISITGLKNTIVFVDFGVTSKPAAADKILPVTWNGQPMSNKLKKISSDNYAGAQFVNSGMKLIWNFPDATKMMTEYISGHFVAPQADLTISGGNFEGGVIAKSVTSGAEGHFYPYFKVETSRDTVPGAKPALKIIETALVKVLVEVGDDEEIKFIKDKGGNDVVINSDNADYQWQVFDKKTGTWNDIPGAKGTVLNPDKSLEGKQIQCTVTGKNDYTGQAVAEGVVRALPPVEKQTSETSITIEAEDGFEYEIRDKSGNVVMSWVTDGCAKDGDGVTGSITFNGLKSDTSYDVVKRAADLAVTESRITEMRTKSTDPSPSLVPNPGSTPKATPSAAPSVTTGGTSGTQTTGQKPGETPKTTLPPEDQTIGKGTVELKIPTIVMKKIMAPKMKFRIKLLNQKGAKVRCSSSNKKIATIDKNGLVKTKKKLGKAKLVINVTKGKKKIQYIVNLVVRTTIKKNYSLYKYKTSYKYPSVSLYKLLPKGKTYKIQLLHLNKTAKVTYKSSKPSIAKVNKKGKVTPVKNGRADITVTIVQNGITYKYFVVVRSTEKGVESNTSYLKVIR